MPKVVISGYYGFHNSGDEAILFAMLQALRSTIPGLEVTVLSRDPDYTTQEFHVRSVPRDKPEEVIRTIRDADILISGGGGLLQDVTSPRSIIYYLGIISIAIILGKPVFCYAQGIGPVQTALGRKALRLVVNRVKAITVRDQDSKEELLSLGVKHPPVQVTADPVLGLELSQIDCSKGYDILTALGAEPQRPIAGISVIPWKGARGYIKVVAKVADDLSAAGWQVLLIPMHNPVDIAPCREVAALMRGPSLMLGAETTYKELLAVAGNLNLALGMRLHFLIFSAIFGVPIVGISYDPKVNRFLRSIGSPAGLPAEDLEYNELSLRVKQALDEEKDMREGRKEKVALLREQALKNAALFAELL